MQAPPPAEVQKQQQAPPGLEVAGGLKNLAAEPGPANTKQKVGVGIHQVS